VESGKLRHHITFQKLVPTVDAYGGPAEVYEDYYECAASVTPGKSRVFMESQKHNAELTHEIRIRYKPWLLPTMRVKFGTRYFDIEPPRNLDERNREMLILAKERYTYG